MKRDVRQSVSSVTANLAHGRGECDHEVWLEVVQAHRRRMNGDAAAPVRLSV